MEAIWRDVGMRHTAPRDGDTVTNHYVTRREIAVRITPMSASANKFDRGVELIAVSTDAGRTWNKRPAPGAE